MKAAENLFAALRRKVALDVTDNENQQAEQNRDFDHIIKKELYAASPSGSDVHPQRGEQRTDDFIEPLHAKNLILNKIPYQL